MQYYKHLRNGDTICYDLITIRYIPTDKLQINRPIKRGLLIEA
jgi:hypothetical protein